MENSKRRVLSIQSHVVAGYVGNKSATFPLQVLGFEVDAINSVQLSNHTQYQHCKGQILNDVELAELIEGLRLNNIHHYSHLLTGYVGNPLFLKRVVGVLKELKEVNPELTYVCDPVMGDNGKMYVPEDLLPIYRDEVIPLADIITPNQYETELLTGKKIKNQADALEAMEILHSKGPTTVVITSSELGQSNFLTGFASSILGKRKIQVMMEIPRFPLPFTGTGDLCSAALLAWMATTNNDLKKSVEMTISTMQDVLKRTTAHAEALAGPGNTPRPEQMELQLIQSKNDIEKPKTIFQAKVLNSESK